MRPAPVSTHSPGGRGCRTRVHLNRFSGLTLQIEICPLYPHQIAVLRDFEGLPADTCPDAGAPKRRSLRHRRCAPRGSAGTLSKPAIQYALKRSKRLSIDRPPNNFIAMIQRTHSPEIRWRWDSASALPSGRALIRDYSFRDGRGNWQNPALTGENHRIGVGPRLGTARGNRTRPKSQWVTNFGSRARCHYLSRLMRPVLMA
jgi:hypothetical protein